MLQNVTIKSVVKRLPMYLDYLLDTKEQDSNIKYISSKKISDDLALGEVQVRKDLSLISGKGKPKIGYDIESLTNTIGMYLGCNQKKKAILIGAGKLGKALLNFEEFTRYGIEIVTGLDLKEFEQGSTIPILKFNEENLQRIFCENKIDIGIICVPKQEAQHVCDILVNNGIKAIWNFAPMVLKVPKDVLVQNENLAYSLSIVSSIINQNNN